MRHILFEQKQVSNWKISREYAHIDNLKISDYNFIGWNFILENWPSKNMPCYKYASNIKKLYNQ